MKTKLLNAFTPAMLPEFPCGVHFRAIDDQEARRIASEGLESFVGHEGSAKLYTARLGVPVALHRASVKLALRETALIGQYMGPRLAEGQVLTAEDLAKLPVRWLLVTVGVRN